MAPNPTQAGPVPPPFVMTEYLRELAPELSAPLRLLFALRTCLQRVNADLMQWLGAEALSPGRLQMLILLWASRAPLRQSDLVRHLGVSRASVSELIETLVREGLVVSVADPSHGRRLLVDLTPEGRTTAEAQIRDNAARLRESFAGLDDGGQEQLIKLLNRLCSGAPNVGSDA